jgi:hypothetical protein
MPPANTEFVESRTAEHRIPIFRLASSGISQIVDRRGRVEASAPLSGEHAAIAGQLHLEDAGRLPWDRQLAPLAVGVSAVAVGGLTVVGWRRRPKPPNGKGALGLLRREPRVKPQPPSTPGLGSGSGQERKDAEKCGSAQRIESCCARGRAHSEAVHLTGLAV